MNLVVTIDTEEDNWSDYSQDSCGIENIKKIPLLQNIFDDFNIIPTYLVTYPVATKIESLKILNEVYHKGKCEIAMHCHPWNTPPFEEERNARNSMLCNLPYDLQKRKLNALHEAIKMNFGLHAKSFRAGRYGYNGAVASVIRDLGYAVETSITPFTDWTEYHGPDFSKMTPEPYRFDAPEIFRRVHGGKLIEIPPSIGYLQATFKLCGVIDRLLSSRPGKLFRVKGLLDRMGLINKVWLSPEVSDARQMVGLTKVLLRKEFQILNMVFHSTSLQGGLGPYVKRKEDEARFLNRLKDYFKYTRSVGIKPLRLSDVEKFV